MTWHIGTSQPGARALTCNPLIYSNPLIYGALIYVALATTTMTAAHGQTAAPSAPREMKAPLPGSLSLWPENGSLKPGTRIMVTTSSEPDEAYPCKLVHLDERGVRCDGKHHRRVIFDRDTVRTIALPSRTFHNVVLGFAIGSAVLTGGGLLCAAAGAGTGCLILLEPGLIGALVTPILHTIDQVRGPGVQTPVYIAPPPALQSDSRTAMPVSASSH